VFPHTYLAATLPKGLHFNLSHLLQKSTNARRAACEVIHEQPEFSLVSIPP